MEYGEGCDTYLTRHICFQKGFSMNNANSFYQEFANRLRDSHQKYEGDSFSDYLEGCIRAMDILDYMLREIKWKDLFDPQPEEEVNVVKW